MFRKLMLTTVTSLGLLAPLAAAPAATAHEFHRERGHERHVEHRHERFVHAYRVYYHDPCRPGWVFAGTCNDYRAAERCAEPYRCRGFAISIR